MKVIVDTSIWSHALRRKRAQIFNEVKFLESLIDNQRICMLGPIRQELLSGINEQKQFAQLKNTLSSFDDHLIITKDYELAAEYFNTCRIKGVQGSNTDYLICAISYRNRFPIFTNDNDFEIFSKYIPVTLVKNY
ncbi:MAG TPA: PIN domain-containing protein [Ignavibacteriaceae bacterium]|nr:PIN domain-containing protein [Ignavibacteriaceae bacterium]